MTAVVKPGVYPDLDESTYHSDPVPGGSLSFSGAKKLLPPSCPAKFRWDQLHPSPPSRAMNLGHAAHTLVLGRGADLCVIDAANYATKAAKEARDAAVLRGQTPLLVHEHETVTGMAAALEAHPVASLLFTPDSGAAEQSLFRQDPSTGVWLRCRIDWLPSRQLGDRLVVPDYKTSVDADPRSFGKSAARFGYHMQAAWYSDMVTALGLAERAVFVFVVQEKTPPYLVQIVQIAAADVELGRRLNRRAVELYAECVATDTWPAYSDEIELVELPVWYRRQHEGLANVR